MAEAFFEGLVPIGSFGGIVLVWWGYLSFARWVYRSSEADGAPPPSKQGTFRFLLAIGLVVALLSTYVLFFRGGVKAMFELEPGEEIYHG